MFLSLPTAASAVSFIGAGLSMVAYGASAAVGLADGTPEEGSLLPPQAASDARGPDSEIGQCIGARLDAYPYKGC